MFHGRQTGFFIVMIKKVSHTEAPFTCRIDHQKSDLLEVEPVQLDSDG